MDEEREQQMSEAVGPDPAIHRRRLRTELRNAREAGDMTQRDVAAAMDWSQSKLIRIESGAVNITTNDLRALLNHYGMDPARIDDLIDVARAARESTRWSIYKDVATPEYVAFLGYESSASIIRNFEPFLVPGLLQTEEYARTVISITEADNPQRIEPLVDLRTERQELLDRRPAVDLHFIMDEAVIRRMTGGRDVMLRQLHHLRRIVEDNPNVTARIMPFRRGMYSRQQVAYWLFEFPNPEDEYVLYVENPQQGEYIVRESSPEEPDRNSPVRYLEVFYGLEQIVSRKDTQDLLLDAINRIENEPNRPPNEPPPPGSASATVMDIPQT
jgi:transcriptional regulator with XRE-family HTH domain